MNDYTIHLGNSRDYLKEIPTESVDLIVSDVPYPTTKRGGKSSTMGGYWNSELSIKVKSSSTILSNRQNISPNYIGY